jgi:sialic acid synthase SpsE
LVFITAEIGVNWEGDFILLEKMMRDAKNAGCDAVKLQAFDEKIVSEHPKKSRLLKSSVSRDNIEQINSISKKMNIEWYCTPMYPDAIDFLDSFVKRYKIRYNDSLPLHENKTTPLISKALETEKQIIVSTQRSPKQLELYNNNNVKWLYVVPKYPCSINELDFSNLSDFDGFSNHCIHFLAPLSAVMLGAKMIEIHVTSNKDKDFIDNPVSFDTSETEKLITLIRYAEKMRR